jgi:hypothetical protein
LRKGGGSGRNQEQSQPDYAQSSRIPIHRKTHRLNLLLFPESPDCCEARTETPIWYVNIHNYDRLPEYLFDRALLAIEAGRLAAGAPA